MGRSKSRKLKRLSALVLLLAGTFVSAQAQEETPAAQSAPKGLIKGLPVRFGMDAYSGTSNYGTGNHRRYRDGMWIAGAGFTSPSTGYFRWEDSRNSAKLSFGTGPLYTSGDETLDQPVEAWYQTTLGESSVTVGKYWVPFGQQEWQLESKPGAMLEWEKGSFNVSTSVNYNRFSNAVNSYVRLGSTLNQNLALGFSIGAGKGLSYNSDHDFGWALDAEFEYKGWRLLGEYNQFLRGANDRFSFAYGKLCYEKLGAFQPFIAAYHWSDQSEFFGRFDSAVAGASFQLMPGIALEGAYADTRDKGVWFAQVHINWER